MATPTAPSARTVVLVEGVSDQVALTALARRHGRDLTAEGVEVVAMGGATNIHRHVRAHAASGAGVRLAGLCDAAEARFYRRALAATGLHDGATTLESLAFFVCVRDLEDELIRALGPDQAVLVVRDEGELTAFRVFQRQPAQRAKPVAQQLHRFLGTHSGRKARYARALVEALPPGVAPPPLAALLRCL
jgi:hypothetical protein